MNLQNYPEIMKRAEVAEVLRLGRYKMNELIFGGKIKVLIIGKSIRIRKQDLIEFIESH